MTRVYTFRTKDGLNSSTIDFSDKLLEHKITIRELLELFPINRDPINSETEYAEGYNHCLIDVISAIAKIEAKEE